MRRCVLKLSTLAFLIFLASLLGACTVAQPTNLEAATVSAISIPARAVSVVDLTKPYEGEAGVFGTGFYRVDDKMFAISWAQVLKKDIETAIRPAGGQDMLDVWIIDGGMFWEKTGADLVPIVNFFTFQNNGSFKCKAAINVRLGARSTRFEIEHLVPHRTDGVQPGQSVFAQSARDCYPGLAAKVVARIDAEAR